MNALDALAMVEDRLQHVSTTVPVHVQIKNMIESVRREVNKPDEKPAPQKPKKDK